MKLNGIESVAHATSPMSTCSMDATVGSADGEQMNSEQRLYASGSNLSTADGVRYSTEPGVNYLGWFEEPRIRGH